MLKQQSKMFDKEQFDLIRSTVLDNLDLVFSKLDFEADVSNGYFDEIRCNCPVHQGDNKTSFSLNKKTGYWHCWTNFCHENVKNDIFGLTRSLLSNKYGQDYSFIKTINWIVKEFQIDIETKTISVEYSELDKYIKEDKICNNLRKHKITKNKNCGDFPISLDLVKDRIKPSEFFANQGFSSQILNRFYVGDCNDQKKPMYMRAYALVLDNDGKNVIGVTGRTLYEKCKICENYHKPGFGCPSDNPMVRIQSKWLHYGFNTSNSLYNEWNVKNTVRNDGKLIVCEGTKNVWWFEQNDINISTCVYGLKILPYHLKRFLEMGVRTLILAFDKDSNQRGQKAAQKIRDDFNYYFKIESLTDFLDNDEDIANLNEEKMKEVKEYVGKL